MNIFLFNIYVSCVEQKQYSRLPEVRLRKLREYGPRLAKYLQLKCNKQFLQEKLIKKDIHISRKDLHNFFQNTKKARPSDDEELFELILLLQDKYGKSPLPVTLIKYRVKRI